MRGRLAVLTVLIALLIACGDEARFVLVVKFPDEVSKQETEEVWVAVVRPPEGADCTGLVAGTARPGEGGYDIDDEMTFTLEGMEGARPLKLDTPGLRLFYAEALDLNGIAILRGCIEEEVGEGRAKVITIELQRVCQQDSDCDNDVWCDGDEVCVNGGCQSGTRDCNDSDICTQDICNEDLDACEHPPVTELAAPRQEAVFDVLLFLHEEHTNAHQADQVGHRFTRSAAPDHIEKNFCLGFG